jgi:hypothetical protein
MTADADKFIPGIFNYCDRWCEKCAYTTRCRVYEQVQMLSGKDEDPADAIEESLDQVREAIVETPAEPIDAPEPELDHPLARLAAAYAAQVSVWMKDHADLDDDPSRVVRWDHLLIHAKTLRALDRDDEVPEDSDGSAKVALISIDRSIKAWLALRKAFAVDEDRILDALVALQRLRRDVEIEFPGARAFRRPGFDD